MHNDLPALPGSEPLSERKKKILSAVVTAYIENGEPVGSKMLADNEQLHCSSATIRNEMAELEALGFLEQPHTSAGRVPSELGYRYYVNLLRKRYEMTNVELAALNTAMEEKLTEIDSILAEASKIASSLTNYTGIALKPQITRTTVERFESFHRSENGVILIMLLNNGEVKTKNLHLPFPVAKEALSRLTALMNTLVVGRTAKEISFSAVCDLEKAMGLYSSLVSPVLKTVYDTLSEADGGDVHVQGVNRLLEYPEYSDVSEIRSMLDAFEEKERLLDMVGDKARESEGVNVYIGKENPVANMQNSAFVYRTIRHNGEVVGAIGVIGPRRMDYSKVIETIDRLATGVDRIINDTGKPDGYKKG